MAHNYCDHEALSRFLDEELGPEEHGRINEHLKYCPFCQKALRANQSISACLRAGLEGAFSHADAEEFEDRLLDRIQKKGIPRWTQVSSLIMSKKFYVPAAAVATALMLLFSVARGPAPEPGPSAIINSFKGDVASVMILETQKSHQTILWFSENAVSGDDNNET
jgi:anti-sigma factor RsiW